MRWAVIDSSVYIDHWERGLHDAALNRVRQEFIVRHSAVVLSELRRGARTREARGLVEGLFRLAKVQWAPTAADWCEAGHVVRTIGDAEGWDEHKRRSFQNDTLIALTARHHGATVVTANRHDFERLGEALSISLRIV
jgi:predicted nucleic acid-binding protein